MVTDSTVGLNAYEAAKGVAAEVIDPYCCSVTIPPKMAKSWTMVSANVMTE